ncbi:MAG: hypothetical protein PHP23_03470 [Desulfobacterales bacterium]|nr:hypothetical protein [Desulfobacterales bacterium]MDD4072212.1 hypothetical protein [Desulfobacterales bacterium]MDD4393061.1 hypothetical protein [Desulfobacterales bacterium]
MKPEQTYQHLKDLAERLEISVLEKSFRNAGINIQSGFCIIRDKNVLVMDKHLPIRKKIRLIASVLSKLSFDDIYILPAIREVIEGEKGA